MTLQQPTDRADRDGDLQAFVAEHRDLLTRVLAHGDREARGYALALLANGGTVADIEEVQRELQRIKEELSVND